MASVSVSEMILFIAAITVALGVATTLTANVTQISSTISERGASLTGKIRTEVEIISDPGSPSAIYNETSNNVTLLIKNTGQKTLAANGAQLTVLIDGEYVAIESAEVVGDPDADSWASGEVLRVTLSTDLDPGDHRISVHVGGDTEILRFRIS